MGLDYQSRPSPGRRGAPKRAPHLIGVNAPGPTVSQSIPRNRVSPEMAIVLKSSTDGMFFGRYGD